jgi:hypothetical protein
MPDKRGGFDRSMQHHLDVLLKDGVHDPREITAAAPRSNPPMVKAHAAMESR